MAVSSEAPGLEAAAVVGDAPTGSSPSDLAVLRELGGRDLRVLLASSDGVVRRVVTPG